MKLASVISLLLVAWAKAQPHARLIGGTDKDEATYEISYQWELFGVKTHFCGGAILSEKWAVTAGHCVKGVDNLGEFYVVVGDKNVDDASKQERKVINKVVYSEYQGNLGPYDIALLELESSLTLTDPIKAIDLPVKGAKLTDSPLSISGWGGTDSSTSTTNSKLQKIDNVKILTYEDCTKTVKELVGLDNLLNEEVNICSTPQPDKSEGPCSGDSGDPLVQDGKLVGIVSWSFSPCTTPNLPTVYTQISNGKVWDFIHDTMNP